MRGKLVLLLVTIVILTSCQSNDNEFKEYDKDDFLEIYSKIYPEISNIFEYLGNVDNKVKVINKQESELIYSFNVDFTYDESLEKIEAYDSSIFEAYNTSLNGSLNMSDNGQINYHYWIIENDDFEMTIVYVNNSKKFISDCEDSNISNIGEDNLVVEIIRKHTEELN